MIYFYEIGKKLSPRCQEILFYCLNGKSNQEIANELSISVRTVKNHKYNIYKALEVSNKNELLSKYLYLLKDIHNRGG